MGQINSNQIIETPPIVIDPAFSPPKGLIGWEFGTGPDGEGPPTQTEVSEFDDDVIEDFDTEGETDTSEDGKLSAPTNLTVISQTIAYDANGNHRVNVIIEFDEVDGAAKYDSRVSK